MGHEWNAYMHLRVGGRPPFPAPPEGVSELEYLNEMLPDTYWISFVFATQGQINRLKEVIEELNGIMDLKILEQIDDDFFLVRLPRYLSPQIVFGPREEHGIETGFSIESIRDELILPGLRW